MGMVAAAWEEGEGWGPTRFGGGETERGSQSLNLAPIGKGVGVLRAPHPFSPKFILYFFSIVNFSYLQDMQEKYRKKSQIFFPMPQLQQCRPLLNPTHSFCIKNHPAS